MPTIRLNESTTAPPEQFVAGITDFGWVVRRSSVTVPTGISRCTTRASVTPTSPRARAVSGERLNYDWSDPNRVVLTTTDSNVWGPGSGHTYTFRWQPDGTTNVDIVVVRNGKGVKGHLLAIITSLVGKRYLAGAYRKTISAIEVRNDGSANS